MILIDYYSILQIKKTEMINMLLYQVLAFTIHEKR